MRQKRTGRVGSREVFGRLEIDSSLLGIWVSCLAIPQDTPCRPGVESPKMGLHGIEQIVGIRTVGIEDRFSATEFVAVELTHSSVVDCLDQCFLQGEDGLAFMGPSELFAREAEMRNHCMLCGDRPSRLLPEQRHCALGV